MKITVDVTEKLKGVIPESCSKCVFATPIEQLGEWLGDYLCECCEHWPCNGSSCIWCELAHREINDKEQAIHTCWRYDSDRDRDSYYPYGYKKPCWCPLKAVD